jgi:phosphohistidine phosphatase
MVMKTLFLVRHSKAVTRKADLPDFQRTLVKAGEKKATSMARKLKKEGVMPDLMISSTANRALETAHLFAKNLDYSNKDIVVKDALYNEMSPEALLYIVRQVDEKHNSIMLFGHNPAFTDFASYLVKGFEEDIPKTGIVGIQFNKDNWKDIVKGSGKLEFFEYPKRLSKTLKRLEAELQIEIAMNVQDVLDKMEPKSAKKMKKAVKKSSDRIAKDFIKLMKVESVKEEKKALALEKAKERKAKLKSKQKPRSKAEPKPKPKPEPSTKAKAKPKATAAPEPKTRVKPKPKTGAEQAAKHKPKAVAAKTTRAASPKRTRKTAVKKQAPKPKASRAKRTTPRPKVAAQKGTKKA